MEVSLEEKFGPNYRPDTYGLDIVTSPPNPFELGQSSFSEMLNFSKNHPYGHPTWQKRWLPLPPPVPTTPCFELVFRLWRAQEAHRQIHVATHRLALQGFYELETIQVSPTTYETRFKQVAIIPPMVPELVSDTAHYLRTCLDRALFAVLNPKTDQEKRNCQFPIVESANDFQQKLSRYMPNANQKIIDVVERLQPYNDGKGSTDGIDQGSLRSLQILDNYCKHRSVPVCLPVVGASSQERLELPDDKPTQQSGIGIAIEGALYERRTYSYPTFGAENVATHNVSLAPAFEDGIDPSVTHKPIVTVLCRSGNYIQNAALPALIELV